MAKKETMVKATGDIESRVSLIEARVTVLEELSRNVKQVIRRKREFTNEERAVIRARLLAGQEAARKRREAEVKATNKVKSNNPEEVKAVEA